MSNWPDFYQDMIYALVATIGKHLDPDEVFPEEKLEQWLRDRKAKAKNKKGGN